MSLVRSNPELQEKLTPRLSPYIPVELTIKQRAFAWLPHREALYGGAAGGGKSVALLAAALQYVDCAGYTALLLRRTFTDLRLPKALMDLADQWLEPTDAEWHEQEKTWRFPSGATLTFGFLEHERDKLRYQSSAFQFIGFDELTHFTETQYTYMFSRRRRLKEQAHIPVRVRSATNPGGPGHDWVHQRFIVEGRAHGRVFIPARMEDNEHLDAEDYGAALDELDPVTKERLKLGNWDIREQGNLFQDQWWQYCDRDDVPADVKWVRYWDLAASKNKGDWTAGVKMGKSRSTQKVYVGDVYHKQNDPATNEGNVRRLAWQDGAGCRIRMEQEPGSSGKSLISHYERNILSEFDFQGVPASGDKVTRAMPYSAAVSQGRVVLVRASWNSEYTKELSAFPSLGVPDDQVDGSSGAYETLSNMNRGGVEVL